jgi:hypothetical protein
MRPALLLASLPGFQPGEAGEAEREGDTLPGLACERDPLAVAGVRSRPLVRRRPVPCDVDEQLGERAERRSAADERERALVQAAPRLRLAEPQWAVRGPDDEVGVVPKLVGRLEQRDRVARVSARTCCAG